MRAVILAAGVGRRLAIEEPKVLLRFGGHTLLERHLGILAALGVRDVVIGIGYKALAIERALAALGQAEVSTVYNPDYEQGSILTLWRVRAALTAGGPVLLMDGDVLYDRRVCSNPWSRRTTPIACWWTALTSRATSPSRSASQATCRWTSARPSIPRSSLTASRSASSA